MEIFIFYSLFFLAFSRYFLIILSNLFQAGLLRLPLNRLLDYLKSLARRDFLSNPDSGVLKVIQLLRFVSFRLFRLFLTS